MKTAQEQTGILYQLLNAAGIGDLITGDLVVEERINDDKEDVVLVALPVYGQKYQLGQTNINAHVPDLTLDVNGAVKRVPNTARLGEITAFITAAIENHNAEDFNLTVATITTIKEPSINATFCSIRVNLEFFNP